MLTDALAFLYVITIVSSSVIPKLEKTKRVFDNGLSDEDHFLEDEHNLDYDHEAFLGEKGAKAFEDLTPEESKMRLAKIVDRIDSNNDAFVTMQELKDWIRYSQRRYIVEDAERQWQGLIEDGGPNLNWNQYSKLTYGFVEGNEIDSDFQYKDMVDRDMRRWKKADLDGNGMLTKEEFVDFVHPEEAEHMKDIVVIETMEDIDRDKDGRVSLDEYIGDMYGGDDDLDGDPDWLQNEKEQFSMYRDKNRDGYMDEEEVKKWILPDDYDNSEAEAKHLIYESDVNRDDKLTKEEILDKYDLFVGSQATDFGEALVHDEF